MIFMGRDVQSFFGRRSDFYECYLKLTDQKKVASKHISMILSENLRKKSPRVLCVGGGSGEGDLQIARNLYKEFGDMVIDYVDPSKVMHGKFVLNAKEQGLGPYLGESYIEKFESKKCTPRKADVILALNSFYFINGWRHSTKTLRKFYDLIEDNGVAIVALRSEDSPHTEIKRMAGGGKTTAAALKASLKKAKMPYYSEKIGSRIYVDVCFDKDGKFVNSKNSYRLLSFILGDRWSRFGKKRREEIVEGIRSRMKKDKGRFYLDSVHEYIWIRKKSEELRNIKNSKNARPERLEKALRARIRTYNNFPVEGVKFRDTTPVLRDKKLFGNIIKYAADLYKNERVDFCVAKDMQGLVWAGAIANELNCGVVPMFRKDLAGDVITSEYEHEYNPNRVVNLQKASIKKGQRVLLVDYILATGETMRTMVNMVEHLGGKVIAIFSLIELEYLDPRRGLENYRLDTIVKY